LKDKLTLSVDKQFKEDFKKVAATFGIKPSAWVEQKMKEFIRENKKV
jgi:antitoxin component of RelBE/YafQ-DinJ toxin-antitoxin module